PRVPCRLRHDRGRPDGPKAWADPSLRHWRKSPSRSSPSLACRTSTSFQSARVERRPAIRRLPQVCGACGLEHWNAHRSNRRRAASGEFMATATATPTREDFAALLEESFTQGNLQEGTVVKGKVVGIEKDLAVIDVGAKTEGRVALREFS